MSLIVASADRVVIHTSVATRERIRRRSHNNIIRAVRLGTKGIERRLTELDSEWDVERFLETTSASLSITGFVLGNRVHRQWYLLPAAVSAFMLQHALQGWCPPLALLRRLGVRTVDEINVERYALKALRGDFDSLPKEHDISSPRVALLAAER